MSVEQRADGRIGLRDLFAQVFSDRSLIPAERYVAYNAFVGLVLLLVAVLFAVEPRSENAFLGARPSCRTFWGELLWCCWPGPRWSCFSQRASAFSSLRRGRCLPSERSDSSPTASAGLWGPRSCLTSAICRGYSSSRSRTEFFKSPPSGPGDARATGADDGVCGGRHERTGLAACLLLRLSINDPFTEGRPWRAIIHPPDGGDRLGPGRPGGGDPGVMSNYDVDEDMPKREHTAFLDDNLIRQRGSRSCRIAPPAKDAGDAM
jgi:hypothetical protein